jgi:bifunctional non-homologous end joining protein LigD
VLFPDEGITKGELAAYYEAIAPIMLPHISRRPITMERYPAGIDTKGFWQKDVSKGFPDWLERIEVPKKDGTVHHPLVTDTRSLLWVTNQNTITPHVWTSRAPDLYHPDVCVFDLDPSTEDEPDVLRASALALRDLLAELGFPSWPKTSGSKGFHILVSLDRKARTGEVARFAHAVGTLLVKRDPQHLTQEFSKADRGGRILVDTGRNGYLRRGLRRAREARRARLRAMHVGGARTRRGRPADVHPAHDARSYRQGRRLVERDEQV